MHRLFLERATHKPKSSYSDKQLDTIFNKPGLFMTVMAWMTFTDQGRLGVTPYSVTKGAMILKLLAGRSNNT